MVSIPDGWLSASSMTRARLRPRGLRGCRVSGNSGSMSAIQNCWVMLSALAQREPKSFIFIRHIFKISSKEFGVLCETLKWVFIWINSFYDPEESIFLCMFVFFVFSLSLFLSMYLCLHILSVFLSLFVSLFLCLSFTVSLSFFFYLPLFISFSIRLSVSFYVCMSINLLSALLLVSISLCLSL